MRLRTLPLSAGGVLLGILLAVAGWKVDPWVAVLVLATTLCLQILSNLSNELGDVLRGTDTADRQGPQYGVGSGGITVGELKQLIGLFVVLCIVSGSAMTWRAFGTLWGFTPIMVLMLGGAAILGAMKYTLGRNPYGYRGKGDIYVFLFFGLVAVLGAFFVCTGGAWPGLKYLLPASSAGFFSVGVLNVNNIRDMRTDAVNRVTVAIRLGLHKARIYQTVLIVLGWVCMIVFGLINWPDWRHYLFVVTLPLFILHLKGVWTREERELDPMLPLLVMSSFAFCLLSGLGYCAFLFV